MYLIASQFVAMFWFVLFVLLAIKFYFIVSIGRSNSKVCLVGKTALITGGYSGLGLETALNLASRGCRVIIADVMDLTATRKKIIEETRNPNIVAKHVDLQSFKSVRALAKDIIATEQRLDILINNAGIGSKEMVVTADGLSRTLQINYFSHALLTVLLIGLLKKSAPSRIISCSSNFAFLCKSFTVDNLRRITPDKNDWKIHVGAYGDSKLLIASATVILSEKLKGTGVTANTYHPGGVKTAIFSQALKEEANIFTRILQLTAQLLGKNVEEGSQTMVHLACDNEIEKVSGKFYQECKEWYMPRQVYNKKFREEMWKATEDIIQLADHEKI